MRLVLLFRRICFGFLLICQGCGRICEENYRKLEEKCQVLSGNAKVAEERNRQFEEMLRQLEAAEHFIFMEYFIVDEGLMWGKVLEILARKAKEGVENQVGSHNVNILNGTV